MKGIIPMAILTLIILFTSLMCEPVIRIEPIQVQISVDEFEFIMGRLDEMDNVIRLNGLNPAE